MSFQNALVQAGANLNWLGNYGNLGTPTIPLSFGGAIPFQKGAGSGVGQANNLTGGTVLVTNGTPTVLDLNTLVAPDGTALTFADLLVVGFWNSSTVAGQNLTVGGGSNPIISIWGSGNLSLLSNTQGTASALFATAAATGWAFNASTAHTFQLTVAAGTNVPVSFVFLGH